MKKVWKLFHFGSWLLSQAFRKVLNVLAIFRYVVKIEVFSEGKVRKKILLLPGLLFEKLTFLSKSWKSVEKRGKFCVKISQEKTSWISRNVWIMAIYGFCLSLFIGFVATPFNRESNLNLIIFKTFLECVGKVLQETQA